MAPSLSSKNTSTQYLKKKKSKKNRNKIDYKQEISVDDVKFGPVTKDTELKLRARLAEAANDFQEERYLSAEKLLASIQKISPDVPEVIELYGLTYYKLGEWTKAISRLKKFESLTGSVEQHPVLADCYRALSKWNQCDEMWDELIAVSPSRQLVEEGRIVQANSLAERDKLPDAIKLLESAPDPKGKPDVYFFRRWYVLANLYEKSGSLSKARQLYTKIVKYEPSFADTSERLADLS